MGVGHFNAPKQTTFNLFFVNKQAHDLQLQEDLATSATNGGTASGKSTPQQPSPAPNPTTTAKVGAAATANATGDDGAPTLLQFTENIASSPAFTVLRQAQGRLATAGAGSAGASEG